VAPTVYDDLESLLRSAGTDLGATEWRVLEEWQPAVFAAATRTPVPGRGDAAPPFLVLALTNMFLPELLEVPAASSGVNYGTGSVRFGPGVRPGDRVRGRATVSETSEVAGGVQTMIEIRVEVDGRDEPACVVESLSRWMR
jgi:acyl dehydratase